MGNLPALSPPGSQDCLFSVLEACNQWSLPEAHGGHLRLGNLSTERRARAPAHGPPLAIHGQSDAPIARMRVRDAPDGLHVRAICPLAVGPLHWRWQRADQQCHGEASAANPPVAARPSDGPRQDATCSVGDRNGIRSPSMLETRTRGTHIQPPIARKCDGGGLCAHMHAIELHEGPLVR